MNHRYLENKAVRRVGNLELVARLVVEGFMSGRHRSPLHGFSVEFAGHRPYVPGDELRFLDWKVYGRQDRLYIKQYEEETNLRAHLLIDASRSMGFKSGSVSKLEYACYCAAALAYLMIRQRDAVGLAVFDEKMRAHISASSRRSQLHLILSQLDPLQPAGGTALAANLHTLAERLHRRGLLILFSDLLDDPAETINALQHFRHKKHEIILFHLLDPAELELPYTGVTRFRDMEGTREITLNPALLRTEYLRRLHAFIDRYRGECGRLKIDYVPVNTQTPYDEFLSAYLTKRARLS
jgi:uncharacterized protein (DUF58 family)